MKAITTRILELIDFFASKLRRFARKANIDLLIHIDFLHKKSTNFTTALYDDLIAKSNSSFGAKFAKAFFAVKMRNRAGKCGQI